MRRTALTLSIFLIFGAMASLAANAAPEGSWKSYFSKTGVFKLYLPDKFKEQTRTMRISPDHIVYTQDVISKMDQRPFVDVVKSHVVKLDQTWGAPLTPNEIKAVLRRDLRNYERHYADQGAVIMDTKFMDGSNQTEIGELALVYNDDEFGPQSLSVRIVLTGQSRVQQILVGPADLIGSHWSNTFFDYMRVDGGIGSVEGDLLEEWDAATSPLQIFTTYTPPMVEPYVKAGVKFEHSDNTEVARYSVFDPLRAKTLDYAVHGYKGDEVWTYEKVKDVLLSEFIVKHTTSAEGLIFNRDLDGAFASIEVNLKTKGDTPKARFTDRVRLKAHFAQNYLMVQEIKGYKNLINSNFAKYLFGETVFHPQKAHDHSEAATPTLNPQETTSDNQE